MRVLVVMPHYFSSASPNGTNQSRNPLAKNVRIQALATAIVSLRQTFGGSVYGLDHSTRHAWQARPNVTHEIDVVVCTTRSDHLLESIRPLRPLIQHHVADVEPMMLGFECHKLLSLSRGRYDFYCYVEDDIAIFDPLFFRKRRMFDALFGPDLLLQPNRYETRGDGNVNKLYVDFRLSPHVTQQAQGLSGEDLISMHFADEDVFFGRTTYPSAGCFILNQKQLSIWAESEGFEIETPHTWALWIPRRLYPS